MRCAIPATGTVRTNATAKAITMPMENDTSAKGKEYKKPALTIGQNAFMTKVARASVINGIVVNKSFNTNVFTKKLFAKFFQRTVST